MIHLGGRRQTNAGVGARLSGAASPKHACGRWTAAVQPWVARSRTWCQRIASLKCWSRVKDAAADLARAAVVEHLADDLRLRYSINSGA